MSAFPQRHQSPHRHRYSPHRQRPWVTRLPVHNDQGFRHVSKNFDEFEPTARQKSGGDFFPQRTFRFSNRHNIRQRKYTRNLKMQRKRNVPVNCLVYSTSSRFTHVYYVSVFKCRYSRPTDAKSQNAPNLPPPALSPRVSPDLDRWRVDGNISCTPFMTSVDDHTL